MKKGSIKTSQRKGNPNPNMSGLKTKPKIAPGGTSARPVQVRVPVGQYEAWMSLPAEKRNTYLRKAIADLLKEENLISV